MHIADDVGQFVNSIYPAIICILLTEHTNNTVNHNVAKQGHRNCSPLLIMIFFLNDCNLEAPNA